MQAPQVSNSIMHTEKANSFRSSIHHNHPDLQHLAVHILFAELAFGLAIVVDASFVRQDH